MDKSKTFARNYERAFGVQSSEDVTEDVIETKVEEIQVKEEATLPSEEALAEGDASEEE